MLGRGAAAQVRGPLNPPRRRRPEPICCPGSSKGGRGWPRGEGAGEAGSAGSRRREGRRGRGRAGWGPALLGIGRRLTRAAVGASEARVQGQRGAAEGDSFVTN